MSVLIRINDIPVFSTINEAELWGKQFGLTGYHIHTVEGDNGYMAGQDHNQAVTALEGAAVPPSVSAAFNTTTNSGGY
tara:strand:+ start:43 stop:276 length:234 start_codon:yes stop_codon:yes gene_type:complete